MYACNDKKTMKQINSFSKKFADILKREGFAVQYYHARSSSSVYIKLDYGMGHTIRISDHKGKSRLKYRYNMLMEGNKPMKCNTKTGLRYFVPFKDVEYMIEVIKKEKKGLIKMIGAKKYEEGTKLNFYKNDGKPGFWANYKLL